MMWLLTESIHYRYSTGAYLMLALPLIIFLFWWLQRKREQAQKMLYGDQLASVLTQHRSPLLVLFKIALLCLSWMLATLALMDPYQFRDTNLDLGSSSQKNLPRRRKAQDVIILIDASASMTIADSPSGETRLAYAKQIADDLIARLKGQSVALYAFTSELVPEVPRTWDYLYTRLVLRDITINPQDTAGTDFLQVLKTMQADIEANQGQHTTSLLLLSDGDDTELASLSGEAKQLRLDQISRLFTKLNALQILTVGMGTTKGHVIPNITFQNQPVHSALNASVLEMLVHQSGASYIANDSSSLELSKKLETQIERHTSYELIDSINHRAGQAEEPSSLYHIPLALAILALAGAILLPETEQLRHKL